MKLEEAVDIFSTRLSGYQKFWCVAGGWAIDFYLDRKTREHEDLEIVVLRRDGAELFAHFAHLNPLKIFSREKPTFVRWNGEPIEPEVIQLRLDPVESIEFDLLLTPSEGRDWICRRDEALRRPLKEVACMTKSGLPVLAPEIVLLFKAKYLRAKDQRDYDNVFETLNREKRTWLTNALRRTLPDSPWITR